ncbi:MAG TPA: DUF1801 domain-containing protein [Candidatus Dojkabacteria bacterium]|nr:DUF1801 domain-containing protein [Candidatus Dojkabacteria bacterium]
MSTIKTIVNESNPLDFINSIENEQRRNDALHLLEIFKEVTGLEPKMWGTSIIGFGSYHYKSERSRQEGDWPLTGFSPRKQNLSIYIMTGFDDFKDILSKIGKFKNSVSCLYVNKLSDIDIEQLKKLIKQSVVAMKKRYGLA